MEQLLVILITIIFFSLTTFVVLKSKSFVFAVGGFLIYYWTLLASLYIYILLPYTSDDIYFRCLNDLIKTFQFDADASYFKTVILYSLFANLIMLIVFFLIKKQEDINVEYENLDDKKTFYFFTCLNIFFLYIFSKAYSQSDNLYHGMSMLGKVDVLTGKIFDPMYNIAKSIFVLGAGFSGFYLSEVFFQKKNIRQNIYLFLAFFMIFLFLVNLIIISNNSSIVFGALVFFCSSLFYEKKIKRIGYLLLIPMLIFFVSFCVRGNILTIKNGINFSEEQLIHVFRSIVFNGESIAAHLSLYSILKNSVPVFFGKSFEYLINAVIPRFIYDHGTPSIYNYYANFLNLPKETGFTIHNASGWYLNFGVFGIILGAVFLGLIWGGAYRMYQERKFFFQKNFFRNCFICLTAYLPLYLRAGPEGIKPLFIFCFFLPFFLGFFAKKSFPDQNFN